MTDETKEKAIEAIASAKDKATTAADVAKKKILETWNSGNKGKAIVAGCAAAAFVLLVMLFKGCGDNAETMNASGDGASTDVKKLADSDEASFEIKLKVDDYANLADEAFRRKYGLEQMPGTGYDNPADLIHAIKRRQATVAYGVWLRTIAITERTNRVVRIDEQDVMDVDAGHAAAVAEIIRRKIDDTLRRESGKMLVDGSIDYRGKSMEKIEAAVSNMFCNVPSNGEAAKVASLLDKRRFETVESPDVGSVWQCGERSAKVQQSVEGGVLVSIPSRTLFVKTSRTYADGDSLLPGFYRATGTHSHVDRLGEKRTYHAFECVDSDFATVILDEQQKAMRWSDQELDLTWQSSVDRFCQIQVEVLSKHTQEGTVFRFIFGATDFKVSTETSSEVLQLQMMMSNAQSKAEEFGEEPDVAYAAEIAALDKKYEQLVKAETEQKKAEIRAEIDAFGSVDDLRQEAIRMMRERRSNPSSESFDEEMYNFRLECIKNRQSELQKQGK